MAATVGLDRDSSFPKASFSLASFFSTTLSRTSANSLTSEPAQNAFSPAPVTTTARTASSRFQLVEGLDQALCHLQRDQVERRVVEGQLRDASCESLYEDEPALSGARQGQITPATIARGLGGARATK